MYKLFLLFILLSISLVLVAKDKTVIKKYYLISDRTIKVAQKKNQDLSFYSLNHKSEVINHTDILGRPKEEFIRPFEASDLIYLNSRYVKNSINRFVSADTIVAPELRGISNGLNRYGYCNNDTVNFIDPSGHVAELVNVSSDAFNLIFQFISNNKFADRLAFLFNKRFNPLITSIPIDSSALPSNYFQGTKVINLNKLTTINTSFIFIHPDINFYFTGRLKLMYNEFSPYTPHVLTLINTNDNKFLRIYFSNTYSNYSSYLYGLLESRNIFIKLFNKNYYVEGSFNEGGRILDGIFTIDKLNIIKKDNPSIDVVSFIAPNFSMGCVHRYDVKFNNDIITGQGAFYFVGGSRYEGIFVNYRREVQGTCYFSNGDRYEGQWVNDKREGQGIFYFSNGDSYQGQWVNDKREGQGTFYFSDGFHYEGQFVNGSIQGQGRSYYPNGAPHYEGQFVNNKREGQGKLYSVDGKLLYEGQFANDKRVGQGRLYHPNGKLKYEGQFVDGYVEGQGRLYFSDGSRYEGQFANGGREGQGALYNSDNFIYKQGYWYKDKYLDGIQTKEQYKEYISNNL